MASRRADLDATIAWLRRLPRTEAVRRAGQELRAGTLLPADLDLAVFFAAAQDIRPDIAQFNHAALVMRSVRALGAFAPADSAALRRLWCVDVYKHDAEADVARGDWVLAPAAARDWDAARAERELIAACEAFDADAGDVALAALCATAGGQHAFTVLLPYGMRDQSNIGHKAIFTAAAARLLPAVDWRHADLVLRPVLRSCLGFARKDRAAEFADNRKRALALGNDAGKVTDAGAERELLAVLRTGSAADTSAAMAARLSAGHDAQTLWDVAVTAACEIVLEFPGAGPLHAFTATNALRTLHGVADAANGRLALLQVAAWLALFRSSAKGKVDAPLRADSLTPAELPKGDDALLQAFGSTTDAPTLRQRRLASFAATPASLQQAHADLARHAATRAADVHEVKCTTAVLEELRRCRPGVQPLLLATAAVHAPDPLRPLDPGLAALAEMLQ
jgi:hypothetical protein